MKGIQKIKSHLIDRAARCVHPAQGKFVAPYVTPSAGIIPGADDDAYLSDRSLTGHYLQVYDWDACFFSQAAYRAGIDGMPSATVTNFLGLQGSDGYIPRTVSPHRIWDGDDLAKPFLAQTLANELAHGRATTDNTMPLAEVVTKLSRYFTYLDLHRLGKHGLYHWRNVLESGVDNNLSLLAPRQASKDENDASGRFPDDRLLACDLNAYLAAEFAALGKLADASGSSKVATTFHKRSAELKDAIDRYLWSEELGFYCNLDPNSGKQIKLRSWTGFVPVLLAVAPRDKAARVIEETMLSEKHFLRATGLSSVAASEPLYNQARRGLYGGVVVSNWQGPMWILPNALAVRYLVGNGYQRQAEDISRRVVTTMAEALENTGTTFENYNAETGDALWAPDFISWNILALEMIETLE